MLATGFPKNLGQGWSTIPGIIPRVISILGFSWWSHGSLPRYTKGSGTTGHYSTFHQFLPFPLITTISAINPSLPQSYLPSTHTYPTLKLLFIAEANFCDMSCIAEGSDIISSSVWPANEHKSFCKEIYPSFYQKPSILYIYECLQMYMYVFTADSWTCSWTAGLAFQVIAYLRGRFTSLVSNNLI